MKNIILIVSVLLFIFIFTGCNNNSHIQHKVTFHVRVKNPSPNQKVYITGNQPELANWKTDSLLLEKVNDSTFIKIVSFKDGTNLEFKVTAGSWWQEALDNNDQLYENFKICVKRDTVLNITVYHWKNVFINGLVVLNQRRFNSNRPIMVVDNYWKYHAGDSLAWAKKDYDDRRWKTVQSYYYRDKDADIGWYRFHFIADSSIWNKSIALLIDQLGASQIFYNGKLLYSFGEIGNSPKSFKPSQEHTWNEWKIIPGREQVLVVRYANYSWEEQEKLRFTPGFAILLKDINTIFKKNCTKI